MSESDQGYGPPKVEGVTATVARDPSRAARGVGEEAGPVKVTITLRGEGFIQRSLPLMVKIGDLVILRNYEITPDRRQLILHLDEMPEDGAVIQVGYAGEQLVELPERFSLAAVEETAPDA